MHPPFPHALPSRPFLVSLLLLSRLLVEITLRLQLDNHLMTTTWTREVLSLTILRVNMKLLGSGLLCLDLTIALSVVTSDERCSSIFRVTTSSIGNDLF